MNVLSVALSVLETALVFVVMVSVLVAAHEYGHYIFARLFGMGAEEFCIGVGVRPLLTWGRRRYRLALSESERAALPMAEGALDAGEPPRELNEETRFTVRAWPIGGFVRIKGMVPQEDGSEVRVPGGFYSKAPWKRLVVLFGGPLFSVLAGVLILFFLYWAVGATRPAGTSIEGIVRGGPAQAAGLLPGDRLTAIDGQPVLEFYDVVSRVRDQAGRDLQVRYVRQGVERETRLQPKLAELPDAVMGSDHLPTGEMRRQAKIGAAFGLVHVALGPVGALAEAVSRPQQAVVGMIAIFERKVKVEDSVGGPIALATMTDAAVRQGILTLIEWAGILSISVGIFNLLPVLGVLDGGQMVTALIEMLRGGRRLSYKVQNAMAAVGFSMIVLIVIGVFFVDIKRLVMPSRPMPEFVPIEAPKR
ncbi:MAG: site-2 protease family protein [Fimbriimonas ginsengisoli]|uniref:Site-2 protease family protein n=1 Tax=Fimbriimonas ginsengisoli TaxID=1005039 RepID=A0A931LWJ1_FIMGI|nr:site-2 protease family protein [Fimbriimonas ginsengisoli]